MKMPNFPGCFECEFKTVLGLFLCSYARRFRANHVQSKTESVVLRHRDQITFHKKSREHNIEFFSDFHWFWITHKFHRLWALVFFCRTTRQIFYRRCFFECVCGLCNERNTFSRPVPRPLWECLYWSEWIRTCLFSLPPSSFASFLQKIVKMA